MRNRRAKIVPNPRYDASFAEAAESLSRAGAQTPEQLERRLKERFPRARVVEGITEAGRARWYAYRDGSWVANDEPGVSPGTA